VNCELNLEGLLNDDWSLFKPIRWSRFQKKIDRLILKSEKLATRVESDKLRSEAKAEKEQLTSTNNSKRIPSNATIRKEYVKCGRSNCSQVKHGPYFYAYWKDDKGKLRKKYIGKYPPPVENTNKVKSSDMGNASGDTVIDPSNSMEDV
jgi:hypothetical protein